ncbi:MAG TPA: hypothetical protein VMG38_18500 [Trebonia sp.]|nr:hypothetical protein [Trebonia sp.]
MPAARCPCGFTELSDETIADHLAVVFTPDGSVGIDGKPHEELSGHACACGFSASSAEALEGHLMAAFTPGDGIGLDGRKHGGP